MQATFGRDGEVKATGRDAAPAVAEGLGACNIKGVDDQKAHTDIAHEQGHDVVHSTPLSGRHPQAGYDPGSGATATVDNPNTGMNPGTQGNSTTLTSAGAGAAYNPDK